MAEALSAHPQINGGMFLYALTGPLFLPHRTVIIGEYVRSTFFTPPEWKLVPFKCFCSFTLEKNFFKNWVIAHLYFKLTAIIFHHKF